jgi:hypothetical protein
MAKRPKTTFMKRDKERARQQKQKDKELRRVEAKQLKENAGPRIEGEDPDIAGITPGPQPLPSQWYEAPNRLEMSEER